MTDTTDGSQILASTTDGTVRGAWYHDVARFAGIPFAAPPVGPLRFRAPQPVEPWEGDRPADSFGPISPQNPSMMDALFGGDAEQWNEDCLYLNVWTKDPTATDAGAPKPVMVWIHGGGFEMGSGSSPMYDGTQFAESGVVLVTINYRLGAFGFLELGGLDSGYAGSGNAGLLDQVAALDWVRKNIANFGGDANNITVFGQSAGAMSISLLMASERSNGLFHKAIVQSGATNAARTVAHAQDDTVDFLAAGGWSSLEDLKAADATDLLVAHGKLSAARMEDPMPAVQRAGSPLAFLSFRPVADGTFIPDDPLEAIAAGSANGVSILTGSTSQEWRLFALMMAGATTEEELHIRFAGMVADPDRALEVYRDDHPDFSIPDLDGALLTDKIFRAPVSALADAQGAHAPAYQYLWDWKSSAFGGMVGAAHAIEIPFVFNLIEDHRLHVFIGADAPRELAHATNEAWINFATTGVPSAGALPEWPALVPGASRSVMVLDTESSVLADPFEKTLRFWNDDASAFPS